MVEFKDLLVHKPIVKKQTHFLSPRSGKSNDVKLLVTYDLGCSHHNGARTAILAKRKYMHPVPMAVDGFSDSFQHVRGQLFVQVRDEYAFLHALPKVEQGGS